MTAFVQTETFVQPEVVDAPTQWPPIAHIRDKRDGALKEGSMALCGAKLMGIELDGMAVNQVCKKCIEIARKELLR